MRIRKKHYHLCGYLCFALAMLFGAISWELFGEVTTIGKQNFEAGFTVFSLSLVLAVLCISFASWAFKCMFE